MFAGTDRWFDARDDIEAQWGLKWVEVWDSSAWSFTYPGAWTALGLNDTSFFPYPAKHQIPGNYTYFIWATSWAPADAYMPEEIPPAPFAKADQSSVGG